MIAHAARPTRSGGFTLTESLIATAIVALLMGGAFAVSTQSILMIRMSNEQSSASQVLQQRIEQLRVANWSRVTDPAWLRDNTLSQDAPGSNTLPLLSETVCIKPYGTSTPTNTFTRTNGLATTGAANVSLLAQDSVQVTWILSWTGAPTSHNNNRLAAVVLSKGGVAK
jgi:prepilin-type N-terminal cleavage/methylation domain-containing protein